GGDPCRPLLIVSGEQLSPLSRDTVVFPVSRSAPTRPDHSGAQVSRCCPTTGDTSMTGGVVVRTDAILVHANSQNGEPKRIGALESEQLVPRKVTAIRNGRVDAEPTDDLSLLAELNGENVGVINRRGNTGVSANRVTG